MLKIGIFGGAFNPPHEGHSNIAANAYKLLKLDEMIIVPTGKSPHKAQSNIAFNHRARMCELAFSNIGKISVSDIENNVKGPSYTINTVRALKQRYPADTRFYLIIGGDMLFYFRKWYRYEALLGECSVVAAARNENEYSDMIEFANDVGRIKVLNILVVEASSTDIRMAIAQGNGTDGLLSPEVRAYIDENGLYRENRAVTE